MKFEPEPEPASEQSVTQWERIFNIVIKHKWDKFFKNLRKINKDYAAKTEDIFERYPRAKHSVYRNLDRIRVKIGENGDKRVNIGKILKNILFQKVVKVKARQEEERLEENENKKYESIEKIIEKCRSPDSPRKKHKTKPRNYRTRFHFRRLSQDILDVCEPKIIQNPQKHLRYQKLSKSPKIPVHPQNPIRAIKRTQNSSKCLPKSNSIPHKFLPNQSYTRSSHSPALQESKAALLPVLGRNLGFQEGKKEAIGRSSVGVGGRNLGRLKGERRERVNRSVMDEGRKRSRKRYGRRRVKNVYKVSKNFKRMYSKR